jgi:hypothetical protein
MKKVTADFRKVNRRVSLIIETIGYSYNTVLQRNDIEIEEKADWALSMDRSFGRLSGNR